MSYYFYGIKYRGANVVLVNNTGKLVIEIKAKNLMCLGKMNVNDKLVLEVIIVINKLISIVK